MANTWSDFSIAQYEYKRSLKELIRCATNRLKEVELGDNPQGAEIAEMARYLHEVTILFGSMKALKNSQ